MATMDMRYNQLSGIIPIELAAGETGCIEEIYYRYYTGYPNYCLGLPWRIDGNPLEIDTSLGWRMCESITTCSRTLIPSSVCPRCSLMETPTPTPQLCADRDAELSTCQVLALSKACDEFVPMTSQRVREVCPSSCGCCIVSGEQCACNENTQVHQIAKSYGFGWIRSCEQAAKYVTCTNPQFGALLMQHCPCLCQNAQL
eukprot:c6680_g1_i2.p1 GENE.c6680_g1_i2~~c6680_g1_i2.p1  ORF type:complete len:200 (+),score=46.32 c6680_g1_i2:171-770(+)